jgi:hypothetical protein
MSGFSRRGFLKALGVAAGAAAGTRIAGGSSWIGNAFAASEPTSVVLLHFVGGYNAIFGSAQPLQGNFGVTAGNFTALGGGVTVDNSLADSLTPFAKSHAACIGVRHGQSSHPGARGMLWTQNGQNAGLMLASAMGGTAAIKAAVAGGNLIAEAPKSSYQGVSFQPINDLQKTLDALGGGGPGPRDPKREIVLTGMKSSQSMSKNVLDGSPASLAPLKDGYDTAIAGLQQPVQTFDLVELKNAYKVTTNAVNSFASKLAAAELMVRSGANVVTLFDAGWDTHGDNNGATVRNKMTGYVGPALNTFLTRMLGDATRNVVVCLFGDFSRSLPGSNHQPNLSTLVFGKYVKPGSDGKTDADVGLAPGTPSVPGMWAYLAAVAKVSGSPFGANPHNFVA